MSCSKNTVKGQRANKFKFWPLTIFSLTSSRSVVLEKSCRRKKLFELLNCSFKHKSTTYCIYLYMDTFIFNWGETAKFYLLFLTKSNANTDTLMMIQMVSQKFEKINLHFWFCLISLSLKFTEIFPCEAEGVKCQYCHML